MTQNPYLVEEVVPERGNVWTLVLRPRGHEGPELPVGTVCLAHLKDFPLPHAGTPVLHGLQCRKAGLPGVWH